MKWISLCLIAGLVLQVFSSQVILLEFKVNQSFISSVLCEKKSIPDNHCNGKCQLKKQLNENHEREERSGPTQKSGMDVLFSKFHDKIESVHIPTVITLIPQSRNFNIENGHSFQVFRPPSC